MKVETGNLQQFKLNMLFITTDKRIKAYNFCKKASKFLNHFIHLTKMASPLKHSKYGKRHF